MPLLHLVVLQHGLHGNASNLEHIAQRVSVHLSKQIQQQEEQEQEEHQVGTETEQPSHLPQPWKTVVTHLASSNDFFRATQQGVDRCGVRLADEISAVADKHLSSMMTSSGLGQGGSSTSRVDTTAKTSVVDAPVEDDDNNNISKSSGSLTVNRDFSEDDEAVNRSFPTKPSQSAAGEVEVELTLVGHSLGGLISRFAAGELLRRRQLVCVDAAHHNDQEREPREEWTGATSTSDRSKGGSEQQVLEQSQTPLGCGGRQIVFRLVNFVSIASPHVGSRRPQRMLFGKLVHFYCGKLASRTGAQLLLEDTDAARPLLETMSDPADVFFRALALFQVRILVSNTCNDNSVGYCTAAISHWNPCRVAVLETFYERPESGKTRLRLRSASASSNNHHVTRDGSAQEGDLNKVASSCLRATSSVHPIDAAGKTIPAEAFANDAQGDLLRRIVSNLQRLGFVRIDAYIDSLMAHVHVAYLWQKFMPHGEDLLDDILDNLIA